MIQNNPHRIWDGEYPGMRERCLVTDEWKLILNNMRPPELFPRGISEIPENNRYGSSGNGELIEELIERLRTWGITTGDCLIEEAVRQWI